MTNRMMTILRKHRPLYAHNTAQFVVVGNYDNISGILAWFKERVHAEQYSRAANRSGGVTMVEQIFDDERGKELRSEIESIFHEAI